MSMTAFEKVTAEANELIAQIETLTVDSDGAAIELDDAGLVIDDQNLGGLQIEPIQVILVRRSAQGLQV